MSFTERLKQALDNTPARDTYNGVSKPYSWASEGNQKRSVR